jgi:hypothetical protein
MVRSDGHTIYLLLQLATIFMRVDILVIVDSIRSRIIIL